MVLIRAMMALVAALPAGMMSVAGAEIDWVGTGGYRILATVERSPRDRIDECPAEIEIDFAAELRRLGIDQLPDLSSLQVIAQRSIDGKPVAYDGYAYGRSRFDRPFRWYDATIAYEFPEFAGAVTRTNGRIVRRPRTRGGYFFNAIGDWRQGRLAWSHTTDPTSATTYAIYFDLLESGGKPNRIPPRGWIGDGTPRCDKQGISTMGADHCRIDLDDWNGDGLIDLIVGEHYGHVFWWPNVGTRQVPAFRACRFVQNSAGEPIDSGLAAAVKVVDWDGDGHKDLLVGAHWNRLLYYRNVGSNTDRQLEYMGLVEVNSQPLEVPFQPIGRGNQGVFRRDYYPVPEVADWDGDGDLDLLLGGYVTGRIFLYENVGQTNSGTPHLRPRGPIEADSAPLNVGHWCAAPCLADFDADGDLDLLTGNMPMYLKPDERKQYEKTFLQYFEQVDGKLQHAHFPGTGEFPRERLATPRAYDWDADGDLDLVVSARMNIYLFENVGSETKPNFQTHASPLTVEWGLAALAVDQFRDWNNDGLPDLVNGYSVKLNSGVGNPFRWTQTESVLPDGVYIAHWSRIGDDWFWPYLDDFDQDGRVDVLFGDWFGHVWFHRNLSTADSKRVDVEGYRFSLTSGDPIKVGPIDKDPAKDFDALQGARTVFTVNDFDLDGQRDLVVGDTYGIIRYYRARKSPVGDSSAVHFDDPVEIGNLGIRGLVDATDWNGDDRPDVIASAANGRVQVFLNNGNDSSPPFAPGIDPKLPPIIQPRVLMVDMNNDGDEDLFLPSTQGSCFVERSFLEHGYAQGKLLRIERRKE